MPPKRKRAASLKSNDLPPAKPSSRDASDEGTEDPDLQEVSALKHKQEAMNPPSKRTASTKLGRSAEEEPELSSSQASSSEDHDQSTRKQRSSDDSHIQLVDPEGHNAMDGDQTDGKPAGLVDPVGYHTNPPPEGRPVRVYADGVFDLFHLGHMRQLEQAKKAFPNTILTVGVTGDEETHRRKGLTVLSGHERAETVRHCRWVDAVIEDCPWIVTAEFLAKHEFDYVAHDDLPYGADEGDDIYKPIKERGMFLVTQRTEGVSTTGIITKIVRDYESYIARQLKRGTSRQDLNISWLKKNELDLKASVKELRETIKSNWAQTGQELSKELRQFWQLSRPSSPAPGGGFRLPNMMHASPSTPSQSHADPHDLKVVTEPVRATAHLNHLDIPRSPPGSSQSPGAASRASSDFATGYSLGLMGGVRSWMTRNRRNVLSLSRPLSPDGEGDAQSMRGRSGRTRRSLDEVSDGDVEHGEHGEHGDDEEVDM